MALKATVYKINLQIADMDRHYYAEHALTVSQHPSETEERMMVRLLAFALNANERLTFEQSMEDDAVADLWQKDLTGAIDVWIDVGLPDEKLIRKACSRAKQVIVYAYGGRVADRWFEQNSKHFHRQKNLTVFNVTQATSSEIAKMAQRTMQLQCNIQDEEIWLIDDKQNLVIDLSKLQ
ncbi:MAG: YaeQ family protein [Methylophilaceae bacterium]